MYGVIGLRLTGASNSPVLSRGLATPKMGWEHGLYRGYIGIIGYILGLYGDNGKENGHYFNGLYIWSI